MKYFLIAGEASGDLHGANLIKELKERDPEAELRGYGGDLMESAGMQLLRHYRSMAYMGVVEVVANLHNISRNLRECQQHLKSFQPDVVILIDYPGFNLRMAAFAKKQGFKTVYFIAPKAWAWKESRVKKIKAYVDELLTILPFETAFFNKHQYEVTYVGNPLLDEITAFKPNHQFRAEHQLTDQPIIALLPGSRKQEVRKILPEMLAAAKKIEGYQWIVAGAPGLDRAFYQPFMEGHDSIHIVYEQTYDVLHQAEAALVTSGTATLEAALFNVPQVVCYKTSPVTYAIGKQLVKISYISLVNLILDREAVRELLQADCNPVTITEELTELLPNGSKRAQLLGDYQELKNLMGSPGASARAADKIATFLASFSKE